MLRDCQYRPACPGCPRFGDPRLAPEALAELERLCRQAGAPAPLVITGEGTSSRFRARLAVRGSSRDPQIGIFRAGTHRVVDIPNCSVQHPRLNEVAAVLKASLRERRVPPYNERTGRGLVRYLQLVVARQSQDVQLVVVANSGSPEPLKPWFDDLVARLPTRLHSLWFNGNQARHNRIFGDHWERHWGPEAVEERVAETRVYYPPGAFGQSNLPLAERLTQRVWDWVPEGQRVLEYYAGSGAIGLGLVSRSREFVFNEIGAHSLRGLELGLLALPTALRAHCRVLAGPAADFAAQSQHADVVIVDPPRKGLCQQLLGQLAHEPPAKLIYVSCGVASFVRDAQALLASGKLALTALEAYGLFPFTEHVETLARFERRP